MIITKKQFNILIAEAMDMSLVDLYKKPGEFKEAFSLYIENMLRIKAGEIIDSSHKGYSFISAIVKAASARDERKLASRIKLIKNDDLMSDDRRARAINRSIERKDRFFASLPLKSVGIDVHGLPKYEYTGM